MTKPITSTNYAGETMTLVDKTTLLPITEGDVRTTSRGDVYAVTGGRAPHNENSTGKVWCTLTPFGSFAVSMRDQREPAYSADELATCWRELSASEQAEWVASGSMEYYPGVVDALWMCQPRSPDRDNVNGATPGASHVMADEYEPADEPAAPDPNTYFAHAEAPETIRRINGARRKAIKAAMAKRHR
jgi:hypothetical protein